MASNHFEEIAQKIREWALRPEHTERQRVLAEAAMELALSYNAKATHACTEESPEDHQDYRVYGCYLCKYVGAAACLCPSTENKCAVSWEEFTKAATTPASKRNGQAD